MKYLVLNHKMNMVLSDIGNYRDELNCIKTNLKIIVAPSNIFIPYFVNLNVSLASQDVSKFKDEKYTGEVSSSQLKSLGVSYSIVGHYERREHFNERINDIIDKSNNLLSVGITPIICLSEKDKTEDIDYIMKNLINKKIIICYEPSYLIGNNNIDDVSDIITSISNLKNYLDCTFNINIPILYGGSVNTNTIESLNCCSLIDGYLVGNASLEIENIKEMVGNIDGNY